ncbi:glycosyltransferase family 39 protein [bacterium]|nr:glycosyltransferase family 39 protein [bacterium]
MTVRDVRENWRTLLPLACIIILAAALRLIGLRWGLPNELHSYSYHPDEFLILGAALFVYLNRSLDPKLYNYPSLYIYLCTIAIAIAFRYGLSGSLDAPYLAARTVTVIIAICAVVATYWAGREFFGKAQGLIAALILAVAPLHVQHSHFATVDVPSTLFIALALGYAALVYRRGDWRDYLWAGVMTGLAAGTRYNAVLVILSVITAHFLRAKLNRSSILSGRLWASIGCMIAAFVVSTPGCILHTNEFIHGLTYEMKHVSSGHGLVFAATGNGFIYTFTSSLVSGLGPLLALIFLFAVIAALVKRDRQTLIILAFVIPYYVLISLSQVRFARYTLPLYPAIAILCAWVMCRWWNWLRGKPMLTIGGWIWAVLCFCAITFAFFFSIILDTLFVMQAPQDCAAKWIFKNVPRHASIGMIDPPWFYSPPLSKDFGFGTLPQRMEAINNTPYKIVVFSKYDKPDKWWSNDAPDWVIVSEYEIRDALRLHNNRNLTPDQKAQVNRILADLKMIDDHYVMRRVYGGILDGMDLYTENLPHDMRYVSPQIKIYERKK